MNRFFIIGNPRSGTTLFRLMLNKHSQMNVPPEAGFLVWLYKDFGDSNFKNGYKDFLNALQLTSKIESWKLDFEELGKYLLEKKPKIFSAVMDEIYEFYSQFVLKKDVSIYGDKNNYYLNHINLLHDMYPHAKFLHIIRDGRSVAASYKGVMEKNIDFKYAPKLPTNIEAIAKEWKTNIEKIESSFVDLPNDLTMTIRYEDLVLDTQNVLTDVCTFLSIQYEEEMMEYYKTKEEDGLEPKEYLAWKSKNLQPIQKEEAQKYKQLPMEDLVAFENIAGDFLDKYRYM